MSITTMEEEIVDANVRLNQVVRQQVSRTSSGIHSFEFLEAWVATSFDHHLLACHWFIHYFYTLCIYTSIAIAIAILCTF